MGTLLLLRHGETTFNAGQVFTGLLDARLTQAGEAQVAIAAQLIAEAELVPDIVWQSTMLARGGPPDCSSVTSGSPTCRSRSPGGWSSAPTAA
ncbi:MAG: histidine phosphatase family protein [Nigerium sp.]|nr:histidine phosphatase family protein [Nigerium sp.]